MSYDKRKEFEEIDKLLNEVRVRCNRAQIPFIWVAAVADGPSGTEYQVAADNNRTVNEETVKYVCNALVPGSLEIELYDDIIKEIVKVLNGFKVVPPDSAMALNMEEFTYENQLFPEAKQMYKVEGNDNNGYVCETDATDVDLFSMEINDNNARHEIVDMDYDGNGIPDNDNDYVDLDDDEEN